MASRYSGPGLRSIHHFLLNSAGLFLSSKSPTSTTQIVNSMFLNNKRVAQYMKLHLWIRVGNTLVHIYTHKKPQRNLFAKIPTGETALQSSMVFNGSVQLYLDSYFYLCSLFLTCSSVNPYTPISPTHLLLALSQQGKEGFLQILHRYMEVHGTVYYETQRPPEVPAFVKNHGLLPQHELQQLLRKAKARHS